MKISVSPTPVPAIAGSTDTFCTTRDYIAVNLFVAERFITGLDKKLSNC